MANVQMPDGSVVAFPDGMSEGAINTAIQQHLSPSQPNVLENYANAIGQGETNTGTALLGLGADAANKIGLLSDEGHKSFNDAAQRARENYAAQNPSSDGLGKFAADILTNPASFVPGGPMTAGAASAAGSSLINSAPNMPISDKVTDAGIGGVGGAVTGKILGSLLGPAAKLSPEDQAAADLAASQGLKLTPGQQSSSPLLGLTDNLVNAGSAQKKQFTQALLDKAGINGSKVTSGVFDDGLDAIGSNIGTITKDHSIPITPDLLGSFSGISTNKLSDAETNKLSGWVDDIMKGAVESDTPAQQALRANAYLIRPEGDNVEAIPSVAKEIPGTHYQSMYSQLGDATREAYKSGNSEYGDVLKSLRTKLSDAMTAQLPPEKAAELTAERQKYANLSSIMQGWNVKKGDLISPQDMAAALQGQNKTLFKKGYGDLNPLVQSGLKYVSPLESSSNKTKIAEALGAALTGFHLGGVPGAVAGFGAGAVAPIVGNKVYSNPAVQSYLLNGAVGSQSANAARLAAMLSGNLEGKLVR